MHTNDVTAEQYSDTFCCRWLKENTLEA